MFSVVPLTRPMKNARALLLLTEISKRGSKSGTISGSCHAQGRQQCGRDFGRRLHGCCFRRAAYAFFQRGRYFRHVSGRSSRHELAAGTVTVASSNVDRMSRQYLMVFMIVCPRFMVVF